MTVLTLEELAKKGLLSSGGKSKRINFKVKGGGFTKLEGQFYNDRKQRGGEHYAEISEVNQPLAADSSSLLKDNPLISSGGRRRGRPCGSGKKKKKSSQKGGEHYADLSEFNLPLSGSPPTLTPGQGPQSGGGGYSLSNSSLFERGLNNATEDGSLNFMMKGGKKSTSAKAKKSRSRRQKGGEHPFDLKFENLTIDTACVTAYQQLLNESAKDVLIDFTNDTVKQNYLNNVLPKIATAVNENKALKDLFTCSTTGSASLTKVGFFEKVNQIVADLKTTDATNNEIYDLFNAKISEIIETAKVAVGGRKKRSPARRRKQGGGSGSDKLDGSLTFMMGTPPQNNGPAFPLLSGGRRQRGGASDLVFNGLTGEMACGATFQGLTNLNNIFNTIDFDLTTGQKTVYDATFKAVIIAAIVDNNSNASKLLVSKCDAQGALVGTEKQLITSLYTDVVKDIGAVADGGDADKVAIKKALTDKIVQEIQAKTNGMPGGRRRKQGGGSGYDKLDGSLTFGTYDSKNYSASGGKILQDLKNLAKKLAGK